MKPILLLMQVHVTLRTGQHQSVQTILVSHAYAKPRIDTPGILVAYIQDPTVLDHAYVQTCTWTHQAYLTVSPTTQLNSHQSCLCRRMQSYGQTHRSCLIWWLSLLGRI